jgi:hypothetical protein
MSGGSGAHNRDYEVSVRGTKYLWGSAGIAQDVDLPLLLHVGNDVLGEQVSISTVANGAQTAIGTINAGEYVTIPLQSLSGVVANCSFNSTVHCAIRRA